jgi:hypothetical protein
VLVEQLRDAVGVLATRYERLANGDLNEWPAISLPPALVGKRAPGRHSSQRHGTEDPHHKAPNAAYSVTNVSRWASSALSRRFVGRLTTKPSRCK